jgi:flagellin FlaB
MNGKSWVKGKKGLTGIETAIILVAFVIVAAAFAFAVLNVGFQSTQKAQDVMRAGMEQASSALELDGAVIAYKDDQGDYVKNVTFAIRLSPGKSPVALSSQFFAISVTTHSKYWPNVYTNSTDATRKNCDTMPNNVTACIFPLLDGGAKGFLEQGDKFLVVVAFGENVAPRTNTQITIELKPAIGNVLTVQRITPLSLTDVMYLG